MKKTFPRRLILRNLFHPACGILLLAMAGCGEASKVPADKGYGTQPLLPAPDKSLLPTVRIAPAVGWPAGATPLAGQNMAVNAYAENLDHPRWLYVLPNGDVLVAETSAPERSGGIKGIKGWLARQMMKRAGAGVPSANRITLLRDENGDGVAETRSVFLEGLNSPFGMAIAGPNLYVANTDAVLEFPYQKGDMKITAPGKKIVDLPAGPLNHHWTKSLVVSRDGYILYTGVGSNSNIGENGMEAEKNRAAILEINRTSGAIRVFASGLRNPVGLAWQPQSGALWTTVNERDELGNDLVPDYMTSVQDGGFYGWPYSYFGSNLDTRVKPQRADLTAVALIPDYALGAHTASLGLTFYDGDLFPGRFKGGAFVAQHGSWNRNPPSGYKVIFIPFRNGKPDGKPDDILTGFLNEEGEAMGRPVGVAIDGKGALLVADDAGNKVWRVIPKP